MASFFYLYQKIPSVILLISQWRFNNVRVSKTRFLQIFTEHMLIFKFLSICLCLLWKEMTIITLTGSFKWIAPIYLNKEQNKYLPASFTRWHHHPLPPTLTAYPSSTPWSFRFFSFDKTTAKNDLTITCSHLVAETSVLGTHTTKWLSYTLLYKMASKTSKISRL